MFTFDDIVAALSDVTFAERSTLIGGQALNYWCHQLSSDNPQLAAFAPFASKDVDVIGTYEDAEALARGLGGLATKPPFETRDARVGWVEITRDDVTLLVDFLSTSHGLTREAVEQLAISVHYGDRTLKVMHPVHCLISRTCNVVELPDIYDNAHGLHQLRACVAMVRGFILRAAASRGTEGGLTSAKRVFDFAQQRPALAVFETHGIDVYDSVPTTGLGDKFSTIGRLRNVETLASARQKFRDGPKYIY